MPQTRPNTPTVEPIPTVPMKSMLNKKETQETRTSSDEAIKSYFEREFGIDLTDSGTRSARGISELLRQRSMTTEKLMHIVDSERGSVRASSLVFEGKTDSDTERGSPCLR
jgi:hypothetical protein